MLRSAIARAFAVLAVAGLVLAPMARPVMAMPSQMQSVMSEHGAADAHMGMAAPADMPCCPDKAPDCGKDCPLMGLCMANVLQFAPIGPSLFISPTLASLVFPDDDAVLSGLAQPPPARPPKA
jgi:hypothetical protein